MPAMKKSLRSGSIKRFITVWVSSLILTCGVLSGAMLVLTEQLKSLTLEAVQEACGSAAAYRLQTAILAENRLDIQFHVSQLDSIRNVQYNALRKAQEYMHDLPATAETDREKALVKKVQNVFRSFSDAAVSKPWPLTSEMHALTDSLLTAVDEYRDLNIFKMENDIRRNINLRQNMQIFLIALILSITAIILVGSVLLIRRIITPAIALSRAAYRSRPVHREKDH